MRSWSHNIENMNMKSKISKFIVMIIVGLAIIMFATLQVIRISIILTVGEILVRANGVRVRLRYTISWYHYIATFR